MALLKFKRSAVPAKIPSIADLALGELAINTYDGKVYTKKDDGTQAIVEVGGGGGVQTITSSDGSVTVTGTTDINLSVPVTAATNTVILPVRNNSGATLAKGTAVYINGALGQNPTVTKAIATGDATSAQTLGLVTANIANNTVGNVTLIGTLTNVDTSAFSDGQQLYLSPTTAGALTATKPYAPNHLVYMAVVEHAHPALGKLFVKVQNGYEMDELHNVSAQNPANNDGLFYNTTTNLWEKKSIATALGYTPANKAGDTFTGVVSIYNSNDAQLYLNGNGTSWAGMSWADVSGSDFIWYNGSTSTFAIGGGGSFVANKKLHVHGGMTIGSGLAMSASGTNSLSVEGNVTSNVDVRAPIFYDSNNTNRYLDPTSTSLLTTVEAYNGSGFRSFANGSSSVSSQLYFADAGNTRAWNWQLDENNAGALWNYDGSTWAKRYSIDNLSTRQFVSRFRFMSADAFVGGSYAIMGLDWGGAVGTYKNFAFYDYVNARQMLSIYGDTRNVEIYGSGIAGTDFRAPIFYDSNDTAFFVDPNSSSVLNTLYMRTGSVQAKFAQASNFGYSSSYRTIVLGNEYLTTISMGVDVSGNASGSFNGQGEGREVLFRNGVSFVTPNSANNGYNNVMQLSEGIGYFTNFAQGTNSLRAPVFYDSNNTGYYIDPASTSLTNIMAVGQGLAVFDLNTVASDPYGLVGITRRTDNNYSYLGFTRAGQHAMGMGIDTGNTFWIGGLSGAGYNSVRASSWLLMHTSGYVTAPVDMRSPLFYDNNNTAFYLDPNGRSNLSNITVASGGTESGIRFRGDTLDFVGRYSNYVSLYNANGPEFKLFDSGYAYLGHYAENGASWRAPIFYDTNDTGRYVDPNSTSNLYRLSSYIAAQDVNSNWNTGFQNTPASSYNYHGDLNGGTNAPAAGWWFYESMRHSNASNFWGTQIAWGWEDNANRMLQRNVTGNSFGGWVEYLNTSGRTYNGNLNMTGSIISTASDVRAPIFYDQNDTSTFINPNGESWIKGDFKLSRVAAGGDNDCFGGLELREVSLVGAAQSAATYAPRVNFHWGARAAATIYMDAGGSFVFGGQGNITSNRRSIFCNELYATGNVTAYYSDDRLKTRIGNIENALDIVSSLNGFRYVDNDLAKTFGYANENGQIGVSAQEVQKHLPEIVRGAAFDVDHDDPDHGSKTGEHYLTVDYSRLVPLLIEAIKELRDEVEALKK